MDHFYTLISNQQKIFGVFKKIHFPAFGFLDLCNPQVSQFTSYLNGQFAFITNNMIKGVKLWRHQWLGEAYALGLKLLFHIYLERHILGRVLHSLDYTVQGSEKEALSFVFI